VSDEVTPPKEMDDKYKAQVVIAPSGIMGAATPLFFLNHAVDMDQMEGNALVLCKPEPLAFALEWIEPDGKEMNMVVNAKVVFEQCQFLGPL
jgi:hypothetical protein